MDPRDRGPAMEPRDPRMRGEGPPGQRNPMEQRGPPDSRGPGDMRGPPDSRDSWPPPERRMPGDPRGAPDARGPPRGNEDFLKLRYVTCGKTRQDSIFLPTIKPFAIFNVQTFVCQITEFACQTECLNIWPSRFMFFWRYLLFP